MKMSNSEIIEHYSQELPNLKLAFAGAIAVPSFKRPLWAKEQRAEILRDGWFVNTPVAANGDVETVEDHVQHLKTLIDAYFPEEEKELAKTYAEIHDNQETIAHAEINGVKRDLNPRFNKASYKISDEDKELIEAAAIKVIYENDPVQTNIWYDYKLGANETAKDFTSLDKICVMWRCVDFVESGKYQAEDFQAYWDYWTEERATEKLTPRVAEIYKEKLMPRIANLTC